MNYEILSKASCRRLALALVALSFGALLAPPLAAQVPARFYWKTLSGANAVPLIYNSMSGNTNPFDPAHLVSPGADIEASLAIAGYGRTFTLFGRGAHIENLEHANRMPINPLRPEAEQEAIYRKVLP